MASIVMSKEDTMALNNLLVVAQGSEPDYALHLRYFNIGKLAFTFGNLDYIVHVDAMPELIDFAMEIPLREWFIWTMGRSVTLETGPECILVNGEPFPYRIGDTLPYPDEQ